jgi:hypothetical protein
LHENVLILLNPKDNHFCEPIDGIPLDYRAVHVPIPILKADAKRLNEIRHALYTLEEPLVVVDFSDVAQSCNTYFDYVQKAARTLSVDFEYFGIALCGHKKRINKLTGNLPLLR